MAQLNYNDFANQVKKKLPEYASMDNLSLARKMEAEYPQYKGKIAYPEKVKTVQQKSNPNQYMSPARPQQLQPSTNPEAYMSKLQGNPNDINSRLGVQGAINNARQPIQDLVDQATMPVKSASQLKFEAAMSNQSPAQYTQNFNADKMVEDELARRATIKQNNVVESELRKNPVTPMGTVVDTALAVPKGAIRGMSTSAAQGIGALEQMIPIQAVQEHGKSITDFYENAYNNPDSFLYKTLGVPMKYQQGGMFDNPANALVNLGSAAGEMAPILLSGAIGGKAATKAAQKMLPSITEKGLQNAGSLGSFTGSMIASMPQYAQESYLQNKQDLERQLGRPLNQDENNKLVASSLGTIGINSALNAIPVMHGLNRFNPAQVANKGFKAGAKNALAQIFEEGATEAGEQTTNELQKAYLGNSEGFQQALKNIGESGLAGGILGGVFGAGGNVVANTGKAQQPVNQQESQQLMQMMDAAKQQEVQPEQRPIPLAEQVTDQVTDQVSEQVPEEEKKQVSAEIVGENAKYNPEPTQEDADDQIADTSKMVEEPVEDEIHDEVEEEFENNSKNISKDDIVYTDREGDKKGSIIDTRTQEEREQDNNYNIEDAKNTEYVNPEEEVDVKKIDEELLQDRDIRTSLKNEETANNKLIELYNEAQDKDENSPEFQKYLSYQEKYNELYGKGKKKQETYQEEITDDDFVSPQDAIAGKNIHTNPNNEEGFTSLARESYPNKTFLDKETPEVIAEAEQENRSKNTQKNKLLDRQDVLKNRVRRRKELDKLINKKRAGKATEEDLNRIDELRFELGDKKSNSPSPEATVKAGENENRINNTSEEKTLENEAFTPTENGDTDYGYSKQENDGFLSFNKNGKGFKEISDNIDNYTDDIRAFEFYSRAYKTPMYSLETGTRKFPKDSSAYSNDLTDTPITKSAFDFVNNNPNLKFVMIKPMGGNSAYRVGIVDKNTNELVGYARAFENYPTSLSYDAYNSPNNEPSKLINLKPTDSNSNKANTEKPFSMKELNTLANKQNKTDEEKARLRELKEEFKKLNNSSNSNDYFFGDKIIKKASNKINDFLDKIATDDFKKSVEKAEDAVNIYNSIPTLSKYSQYLQGYKIAVMRGRIGKNAPINGSHNANKKLILINKELVGNDLELAINTLAHEATHAKQYYEYNEILKKESNGIALTNKEIIFKKDFERSKDITDKYVSFRTKYEDIISKIDNNLKKLSNNTSNAIKYYNSLGTNEKKIYNIFVKLNNLYETCSNEKQARENGSQAINDFIEKEIEDARRYRYTPKERNNRRKSYNRRIFEPSSKRRNGQKLYDGGNGFDSLQFGKPKIKNEWDFSYSGNLQPNSTNQRLRALNNLNKGNTQSQSTQNAQQKTVNIKTTQSNSGSSSNNNATVSSMFSSTKTPAQHAKIRDKITKVAQERRSFIEESNLQSSNSINKVISKSQEIGKKYNTDEVTVRELMTFLRENSDLSEIAIAKKVLPKEGYRDLYRLHNKLSQEDLYDLKRTIDSASEELDGQWEKYAKYRENYFDDDDRMNVRGRKNYILHSWQGKQSATMPVIGKKIAHKTRSEKERQFQTYKEGIDANSPKKALKGTIYAPTTLDAAELLKMHSKDVVTKVANGRFQKELGDGVIVPNINEKGKIVSYLYNPEFKKPLEAVLGNETQDVKEPTKARQAYRKVNNLFKRYAINIGSLFHHSTLSESRNSFGKGIEAILPTNAIKTQFNAIKSAFKDGDYEVLKRIPEAKEALKYGVKLGVTNDIDIESARKDAEKILGKKFGRVANKVAERMDKVLWDSLANTYKINTFNDLVDTYTKYYEDKKKGELPESVKRELAQFVNDSFGGQNYDTLQIKDSAVKTANDVLLSTDWTLSTMIRQSASVLSSEKMQRWLNKVGESSKAGYELKELLRKAGIGSFTNDIEAAGIRGKAARIMFAKALVQAQIREKFMTGLNLLVCYTLAKDGDDEDDKPTAGEFFNYNNQFDREFLNYLFPDYFIGRDDKKIYDEDGEETGEVEHNAGKEMYVKQGKQFKEIPELVQGGLQYFGWNLMDRMASKMSPLISGLATKGVGTLADKYGDEFVKNKYGWKKDIKKRIPYTDFEYDSAIPLGMPFALSNIDKKTNKANKLVASIYSGVKEPNSYQASDEIMKKLMKGDSNIQTEEFSKKLRRNGLKDSDYAYDRMVKIAVREALENKNSRVNTNREVRRRFFRALKDYGYDDYDIQEFKNGNYDIYGEEE